MIQLADLLHGRLELVIVGQPGAHLGTCSARRLNSELHAWGDSNLYVRRRGEGIVLSIEHRAAASPPPVGMVLITDEDGEEPVRLEIRDLPAETPLAERILTSLAEGPRRLADLRQQLGVRKLRLLEELHALEKGGRITRAGAGWQRVNGH